MTFTEGICYQKTLDTGGRDVGKKTPRPALVTRNPAEKFPFLDDSGIRGTRQPAYCIVNSEIGG
jgi:hypothetical protein